MAKILFTIVLIVLVLGLGLAAYQEQTTVRGDAVHSQLPPLIKSLNGEQQRLAEAVRLSFEEYRSNARRWSLGYHGLLILSALLSAGADVVLKLNRWPDAGPSKEDAAAVLAAGSALAITIVATIGFESKWQANRVAAAQVQDIALEIIAMRAEAREQSHEALAKRFREASKARDIAIAGTDPDGG